VSLRGAFITLEGTEGVGKSTSAAFVANRLQTFGKAVELTREPGGTPLGETLRAAILGADRGALSAEVETLLMFAARAEHLDRRIRPALAAGRWVVCDRFTDATRAYQGGGRGADADLIETLATAVQRGVEPDLTLLLDAPLAVGRERIASRRADHFEKEDGAFFERVRAAYLELARAEPTRVRLIDASRTLEAVTRDIAAELDAFVARFAR
jgi:dTMP kinase